MLFKTKLKKNRGADLLDAKAPHFRARKAVTALDLDGDILRVVAASASGKVPKITRIASTKIAWDAAKKGNAASDGEAVRKALRALNIKPKEAALAVPRGQMVLRPLRLPLAADLQELAGLVNFQIARDLPFRLEDAAIDFKVLRLIDALRGPEPKTGESGEVTEPGAQNLELIVGAVKTEVVQYYRNLAKAAGFKLAGLGLRSSAQARCVTLLEQERKGGGLLMVTARQDEITIDILSENNLLFSRVAVLPENCLPLPQSSDAASEEGATARRKLLDALGVEVVRSLHAYEGSPGSRPVDSFLVCGTTGLEPEISRLLAGQLNLPGSIFDPAAKLKLPKASRSEAAGASAAIGLAAGMLEPSGLSIDFANPKKPAEEGNKKRTQLLLAAAAAVVVLIGLLGARAHLIGNKTKIKLAAQQELTDAEKKVPIYKRLKAQNKSVQSWVGDEQDWLDHLAWLSAILPPADQVYVSAINTSPQHVVRLSVQSKTGELLAELDKKLRAAGYEVKPLSITPANDKYGYGFRTTVELAVPRKMKPDLTKATPPARPADDSDVPAASAAKGGRSR
jgi:Tfp pilus assembly PilM family ATPase